MKITRLAIIGVGLIGGSLAQALRETGAVGEVVGCGRGKANLEKALELEVIDRYTHDIGEAVDGADMIFVAVPLGAMKATFQAMRGHLSPNAIITDGGSAKGSVVSDAIEAFGELPPCFVPGHPIAGTERSGVEAAFPTLYQNRRVILTPLETTDPEALAKVEGMWRLCGADVTQMGVEHHDEVLAATSHLPHMLAFSLVDTLAQMDENSEIFRYAAGGFSDFTRIASSSPVMWRDICLANRHALGTMLEHFAAELTSLSDALQEGDGERLLEIFERAKSARDRFTEN